MLGTMLIVEDEETSRAILKLMFQERYDILEAYNGEEALQMVEELQGKIDIVVLDLMMSPVNGYEVLEKRKEMPYFRDIPVVVITAKTSIEDQIEALKLGATDFISKPFIPEIVYTRISNVMTTHERMFSMLYKNERMKVQLQLDEMTGTYNKATAEALINRELADPDGELAALMIIDVDNFKFVNDTKGHLAGDNTLRIIANLLTSYFRKTDIVGRIGGDEFVVLMKQLPSKLIAAQKIRQLVGMLRQDPNLTMPANVTVSVGYAFNNYRAISYKDLFARADQALYHAKQRGKACAEEYDSYTVPGEDADLPVVFVVSTDRSVAGVLPAIMPTQFKTVLVSSESQLVVAQREYAERLALMFVDVSEAAFRQLWQEGRFSNSKKLVALCREGHLEDYNFAIAQKATDILTKPIEERIFKRRIMQWF